MNRFLEMNKDALKGLLSAGLDFMGKNHPQHLEEYIRINRETFAAADVPLDLFDSWVIEWRKTIQ